MLSFVSVHYIHSYTKVISPHKGGVTNAKEKENQTNIRKNIYTSLNKHKNNILLLRTMTRGKQAGPVRQGVHRRVVPVELPDFHPSQHLAPYCPHLWSGILMPNRGGGRHPSETRHYRSPFISISSTHSRCFYTQSSSA